jgi:hypothetical protein
MTVPPKRSGALLRDAPASPKLLRLAQSNSRSRFAQGCTHEVTRVELMPQGHTHHARVICIVCGRFLRWLPKPGTIERRTLNSFRLARLGMCSKLTDWERAFIHDVSQQRKLSPKQQQIIDRLCADYLERRRAS